MNADTALMFDVAHAALLALRQANEEGREVSAEELAAVRAKLDTDIARVQGKLDLMS